MFPHQIDKTSIFELFGRKIETDFQMIAPDSEYSIFDLADCLFHYPRTDFQNIVNFLGNRDKHIWRNKPISAFSQRISASSLINFRSGKEIEVDKTI